MVSADRIKAKLVRQAMLPGDPKSGGAAQAAGSWSLYLNECAELFGRGDGPLGDASALGPSLQLFREN